MAKTISVLLTDTHLKKDNLDLVEDIFRQACEVCIEQKCKTITHAGDWFTNRIGQNLQTLLRAKKIFEMIESYGLEIIGIPGNHDKTDQNSESSYLDVFENYKSFRLIKTEGFVVLKGVLLGFIPYFSNPYYSDRLSKLNKMVDKEDVNYKILITHVSVNGVKNNDGSLVEEGVSPKRFKLWDEVIVGHYHDASKVGSNINYVGSAYQSNYGEDISGKGFTLIKDDGTL